MFPNFFKKSSIVEEPNNFFFDQPSSTAGSIAQKHPFHT